jgi:ABC-type branched-subunit amino acid transport system ATPase component
MLAGNLFFRLQFIVRTLTRTDSIILVQSRCGGLHGAARTFHRFQNMAAFQSLWLSEAILITAYHTWSMKFISRQLWLRSSSFFVQVTTHIASDRKYIRLVVFTATENQNS